MRRASEMGTEEPMSSTNPPNPPLHKSNMKPLILKLPNELFLSIVGYVSEQQALQYFELNTGMSTLPLINFSMTCRRFREASYDLLVPRVSVDFRNCSLERLEQISGHESLRKGIRHIDVELTAFNQDLAFDFDLFCKYYIARLENFMEPQKSSRSDRRSGPALEECKRVVECWKRILGAEADQRMTDLETDEVEAHRALLLEAHERYKELYNDQKLLLESAQFLNRVTAAMARMPRVKSLTITDQLTTTMRSAEPWNPPVRRVVYPRDAYYLAMRQGMAGKLAWSNRIGGHGGLTLSQSKLYSIIIHLPIAMHGAGISLTKLQLRLDGLQEDAILEANSETLAALSYATQSLKSVNYTGSPINNAVSNNAVDALSAYLAHLVKNPNLETIAIDPCGTADSKAIEYPRGTNENNCAFLHASSFNLSPDLPRKHLSQVYLHRIAFHQKQLISFLASLPTEMEFLHLHKVALVYGNWEDILDVLRTKKFASRQSLRLGIEGGGEYNSIEGYNLYFLFYPIRPKDLTLVELYCLGLAQKNPLREAQQEDWDVFEYMEEEARRRG